MTVLEEQLAELSTPDAKATYVEVGSGTNEAGARLLEKSKTMGHYVGLDLARAFLEWSQRTYPQLNGPSSTLIHGNAVHLAESMAGLVPDSMWSKPRLMGLVMNTIGVLPDCIRQDVVRECVLCAGTGGTVLVGCWWSGAFKRGVEEFYKLNPELCGEITDDMVNLEKATLLNPKTGYSSQWWSEARVRHLFEGVVPDADIEISTAGVGIFARVKVTELHVAAAASLRPDGAKALSKYPGYAKGSKGATELVADVVAADAGAGSSGAKGPAAGSEEADTEEEDEATDKGKEGEGAVEKNRGAEIVPPIGGASSKGKLKGKAGAWEEGAEGVLSTADGMQ